MLSVSMIYKKDMSPITAMYEHGGKKPIKSGMPEHYEQNLHLIYTFCFKKQMRSDMAV